MGRRTLAACCTCLAAVLCSTSAGAQEFRVERIASGLSQPTYVTQAPGDPANILYFTERTSNTRAGFNAVNQMGKVWRYDVNTRTKTPVLDLSNRNVTEDAGLQTIAFGPDFNTPGAPTYHKMYVSSAETPPRFTAAQNRVEEYALQPDGTFGSPRVVLEYNNNHFNNHTVNWVGFGPDATGAARNYLYISTGDSSYANPYNGGTSPAGRPSQNPNDVRGKLLRVDVSGADAYPSDPLKNFAIPAANPIPAYNAAHPTTPIAGLGEVYVTGIRNASRMSFDRGTGDIYMGDVGEVAVEEVDFLKAGSNPNGPPADFGWPQREGTQGSGVPGAPQTKANPFTGVTALEPVRQFNHTGGGNAVIGGYAYRGPVASLTGKYFYADYVSGRVWQLELDRDTDPSSFNGSNGTLTEVTSQWNAQAVDPNDPNYTSAIGPLFGIDHLVSFGEDNAGNLYIVDFGYGTGFDGQYPGAGLGEIFRVTPVPEPGVTAALATAALLLLRRRPRRHLSTAPRRGCGGTSTAG
jgi:glucose/arabinose dehydrogenase